MSKRLLFLLWSVVAGLALSAAAFGAERGLRPSTLAVRATPQTRRVSVDLAKRLSLPVSRVTLVKSLLANAQTRALVAKEAAKAGVGAGSLSSLGDKALPWNGAKLSDVAAAEISYSKLKWDDGITFDPFAPPTFYSGKYRVGTYRFDYADITFGSPGSIELHPPFFNGATSDTSFIAALFLDLPAGKATYMVALKLTDQNGNCPQEWLNTEKPNLTLMGDIDQSGQYRNVTLTPIVGEPGYAGLIFADPHASANWEGSGMRGTNSHLRIDLIRYPERPHEPYGVVFGSITITRL